MGKRENIDLRRVHRDMVDHGSIAVNRRLYDFITSTVLDGTSDTKLPSAQQFWDGYAHALERLSGRNLELLRHRDTLQRTLDDWCSSETNQNTLKLAHKTADYAPFLREYKQFLTSIGVLVDDGDVGTVAEARLDDEVSTVAGPQLVVPLTNARFALNAANARWGSLFDALYGSDMIPVTPGLEPRTVDAPTYNPRRGAKVIAWSTAFLDGLFPLTGKASFINVRGARLVSSPEYPQQLGLVFHVENSEDTCALENPRSFVGYSGAIRPGEPSVIPSSRYVLLFRHNGLYIQVVFDPTNQRCREDHPGALADVLLEAAMSTIQDCEDSVAAVDGDDKLTLYQNWLGLMRGTLTATVPHFDAQRPKVRRLAPDYVFKPASWSATTDTPQPLVLHGRSLLLIRHTAHHVYTDLVLHEGRPTPEAFLDAFVTSLVALHDLRRDPAEPPASRIRNSRAGCVYVVKPKLHGPAEAALVNDLFDAVEDTLELPRYTLKCGLMDEERRTSLNLASCITTLKDRLFFINTGFLDRTADEIRSSFYLGPFDTKENLKVATWIQAYEKRNVLLGVQSGLAYRGQIGKGMWPFPDAMSDMFTRKRQQLFAGATTSWVPSPKAATLHAVHYHQSDVRTILNELREFLTKGTAGATNQTLLDDLLRIPVRFGIRETLSAEQIQQELDNNLQGLLGYVVRWVDLGIGCSKIPDIHGVNLMEDRATLRISALHVANWLYHGVVTEAQVFETLRRLAGMVDQQNGAHGNAVYHTLAPHPVSCIAFQTAIDLVFKNFHQSNGYTEHILYQRRLQTKALAAAQRAAMNAADTTGPSPTYASTLSPEDLCVVWGDYITGPRYSAGCNSFCSLSS